MKGYNIVTLSLCGVVVNSLAFWSRSPVFVFRPLFYLLTLPNQSSHIQGTGRKGSIRTGPI